MRRLPVVFGLALAVAFVALGQRRGLQRSAAENLPAGSSDAEKRVLAELARVERVGELYLNVQVADGRMLRLLTEAAGAKNVVELGTSTGFSSLWLCLALQKTGGHLTTFEYDSGRAATAREHFKNAGVDQLVTVVEGDAHQTIARLTDPIDVVFIDADKAGYLDYLSKLLPLVRPGGLSLAHNIDSASDYIQAVTSNPALETLLYSDGGGLSITLKKR